MQISIIPLFYGFADKYAELSGHASDVLGVAVTISAEVKEERTVPLE